ncbi:MAG: thermonuclease family protein [bacterium]
MFPHFNSSNFLSSKFAPIIFFTIVFALYLTIGILKREGILLGSDEYTLNYVLDGDTIDVSQYKKSYRVRYIGIDTPEIDHPLQGKVGQCYGNESKSFNEKLLKSAKKLKLVRDKTDKDIYGRLLRYVYVDNIFVNEEIIKNGYAYVLNIPPNSSLKDTFQKAKDNAKESNIGVWVYCAYDDKRAK